MAEWEFDPAKNEANLVKHGVSLSRANQMAVVYTVKDERYDEERSEIMENSTAFSIASPTSSGVRESAPSASGAVTWKNFSGLPPEDREAIERHFARHEPPDVGDEDNPAWTLDDFKQAIFFDKPTPSSELTPELLRRAFGRPKSAAPKVATKLRIDPDVLDAFKSEGPGWQTRMNAALRNAMPSLAKNSA